VNKKSYIDMYVLRAKQGDKEAYKTLRIMYDFVLEGLFQRICIHHPSLKTHKIDIFHNFYMYFWDIIMSYTYTEDSFGCYLKEKMAEKITEMIEKKYEFPKERVVGKEDLLPIEIQAERMLYRKTVKRTIKNLSSRQKEFIYFNYFLGIPIEKSRSFMLLSGRTMRKHSRKTKENIRRYISPSPKRAKGKKNKKEIIYRVYQKRIRENNNEDTD